MACDFFSEYLYVADYEDPQVGEEIYFECEELSGSSEEEAAVAATTTTAAPTTTAASARKKRRRRKKVRVN